MITGYEVCKDPAEGELQKNGRAAQNMHAAAPEPPQAKRAAKAPACKIEHPGTEPWEKALRR